MNRFIGRVYWKILIIAALACLLIAIVLPVPAANLIWTGAENDNWGDFSAKNWLSNGAPVVNGGPGPTSVTFNDIGEGTVNIVIPVEPASITFDNNLTNYIFTQNASTYITGPCGLTKNGTGTVTLQNPNNFTGDVTVNGGTLDLGYYDNVTYDQHVLYNGVPPGNLILGGGTINQNAQANTPPFEAFENVTINPGASQMAQSPRAANEYPVYVISNTVTRVVGGVLNVTTSGKLGFRAGVYFESTNSPDGTNDFGRNGIVGGWATYATNDWLYANNAHTTATSGNMAYPYYQADNNPADWGATSNVLVGLAEGNPASIAIPNDTTIYSLKLTNGGPVTINIASGQTLTLSSGGLLLPSAADYLDAINGGYLQGAAGQDLILLNENTTSGSSLTIRSVIGDNGGATGLTTAGGGKTILTGNNTYTGPTYINAGTLVLADGGSISRSPLITVSLGATIDASQLSSGTLNLAGGQTLNGNGNINGSVVVSPGAVVAPSADDIGTLTFSNDLSLAGTAVMKLVKDIGYPNHCDLLAVGDALTYGGTLDLTNIGTGMLTNGDSFKLFSAGSYSGAFTDIVPATPGAGLVWNVGLLAVNGTLSVTYPPPQFASAALSGTNFTFLVTNSVAGATNYILTSTNLALPLADWTRLATNVFDARGNLAFTNRVNQNQPVRFYRLQLP